ncbi:MAG: hypothetical protein KBT15_06990 [Bacteroidales bacterium]|nr:hypothetical protein [Candidatus Minthousia equi]
MAGKIDYIDRKLEQVIAEAAEYFSVISVTGPRQSGKSTLLKHHTLSLCCLLISKTSANVW